MEIDVCANGPFVVNSYLVSNGKRCFLIDPGLQISPLLDKIEKNNLKLEAILATHGHIDHIDGVASVKKKFSAPFYVNMGDKDLIDTVSVQARMFGVPDPGNVSVDKELPSSGEIEIAGLKINLLYTPGHSKGSVSLYLESENVVFSGDALFNFSIGRTDLPGGNYEKLISSIRKKLFVLPDKTRVLSGHGPETTIGHEKKLNPFFN